MAASFTPARGDATLTPAQQYEFDASGWIRVPLHTHPTSADLAQLLDDSLAAAAAAGDSQQHGYPAMLGDSALADALAALCGAAFKLDKEPKLVTRSTSGMLHGATSLHGGPDMRGREYHGATGAVPATAMSVLVLLPVDEQVSVQLVPASHRSSVPAPVGLLTGLAGEADPHGVVESHQLVRGEAMLMCSDLLHAIGAGRLLATSFVAPSVAPTSGYELHKPPVRHSLRSIHSFAMGVLLRGCDY